MTEQAYMSKENYDRLSLLEPRALSEEEKKRCMHILFLI